MNFLKNFGKQLKDGDFQLVALGLSYVTVLSIVPFFAVGLAALQSVDSLDFIYPQVEALVLSYFKGPVGSEGLQMIKRAIESLQTGRIGVVSSIGLFLSSSLLIHRVEVAIHRIWSLKNSRPLYRRIFFHWLFLILIPFCLAIIVAMTSAKVIVAIVPLPVLNWLLLFVGLIFMYKFVPATKVKWWVAVAGSSFSSVLLAVLFSSFKFVTKSVLSYNKLYGGLAAIPTFLVFVLIFWYIVLVGAALCAGLSRKS